jgi:microcompartment protein CcmL/EutN
MSAAAAPPDASSPALALIELGSIARGYQVADAMVKKAPIALLDCRPVSPGKLLVLVAGDVASVDEAFRRGLEIAADRVVDKLFLPQAHDQIPTAVRGEASAAGGVDSLAVIETTTVAATILAADAAAKAAAVRIIEMQLARGIGGKAFFTLSGDLAEIEAAVEAATNAIDRALLIVTEIIPAPHEDLVAKL